MQGVAKKNPMVVIQGGSTPDNLPDAIAEIARLKVELEEANLLKADIKGMGALLAHLMGKMGILEVMQKAQGRDLTIGEKMKLGKRFSSAILEAFDEDSEIRQVFKDEEKINSFKRILAYASTR